MPDNRMREYAHKEHIKRRLSHELPGEAAHAEVMGYSRNNARAALTLNPPPRESAVMMLIFPQGDVWSTLLIRRQEYEGVHSGQLSFPGGKRDDSDGDLLQTALRELHEEVGIAPNEVEVLGTLSAIYIPPSHFLVTPFVGYLNHPPSFTMDSREVAALLIEPLAHFLQPLPLLKKRIFIPSAGLHIDAPYFDVQGHTLWGATAMMIHEFRMAMSPEYSFRHLNL